MYFFFASAYTSQQNSDITKNEYGEWLPHMFTLYNKIKRLKYCKSLGGSEDRVQLFLSVYV